MLHASTQQLIRKLYELTSAGSLAWTEGGKDTARLETEGYIVEVAASPPTLRLLRADGRELETATSDDLAAVAWPSGDGTYATRVTEMAGHARRIALGAEKATATFGETPSFARVATVDPRPTPRPSPPNILTHGISARSVQYVEQATTASFERFAPAAPKPQATLRAPSTGPNVYKPWN